MTSLALDVENLVVRHHGPGGAVTAVDGVSLEVPVGHAVGLVGESGSGKSSLARALVGLTPYDGRVLVGGRVAGGRTVRQRRRLARHVQMVFQDPDTALDPRMTVHRTLAEAARAVAKATSRGSARERTTELLQMVGLDPELANRLPSRLSGGQRQRVALARALAVGPGTLIADEITSALDASSQAAILGLVRDLRDRLGLSLLFISHQLTAVRYLSDVVAVMYLGRIVETAPAGTLLSAPRHPYTRALVASAPRLRPAPAVWAGPDAAGVINHADSLGFAPPLLLPGDPADPLDPPTGCRFHPRCPFGPSRVPGRSVCAELTPRLAPPPGGGPGQVACHFPLRP
ncbi:ABC transporter ATP-binding protein [Streptomyces hirsutus]|uniref:ABC transporter ATP-binding protein n=1 Tax=Streptomyces hirsutus TaxID=35620 RepID=UPI003426A6FF